MITYTCFNRPVHRTPSKTPLFASSSVGGKDYPDHAVTASLPDFLAFGNNAGSPLTAKSYYDCSGRPHLRILKPSATGDTPLAFLTSGISVEKGPLPLRSQTSSESYTRIKLGSRSCAPSHMCTSQPEYSPSGSKQARLCPALETIEVVHLMQTPCPNSKNFCGSPHVVGQATLPDVPFAELIVSFLAAPECSTTSLS